MGETAYSVLLVGAGQRVQGGGDSIQCTTGRGRAEGVGWGRQHTVYYW